MPELIISDLPDRIRKAAADVRDTERALRLAISTRDRLIVQAADHRVMTHRAIAEACGFRAVGAVSRILAKPGADD